MVYRLSAACGCSIGQIRDNNEDNFYFNGHILSEQHNGLNSTVFTKCRTSSPVCFAVFDGMGGEDCGELASYTAAAALDVRIKDLRNTLSAPREFLESSCCAMSDAVYAAGKSLAVGRMGTTVSMLLFSMDKAYVCNIGDSRAYLLRNNELIQISEDHVERLPPGSRQKKTRLTQYLGVCKDELMLEPHIAAYDIQPEDIFLLCSDGLTDMLTGEEICTCITQSLSTKWMVSRLIDLANHHGGRDNITALIIKIQ